MHTHKYTHACCAGCTPTHLKSNWKSPVPMVAGMPMIMHSLTPTVWGRKWRRVQLFVMRVAVKV